MARRRRSRKLQKNDLQYDLALGAVQGLAIFLGVYLLWRSMWSAPK